MSNQNLKQHERINWAVTNCSTAANYYHLLRRQVRLSDWRTAALHVIVLVSICTLLRCALFCAALAALSITSHRITSPHTTLLSLTVPVVISITIVVHQVKRGVRKPRIANQPNSLLRLKEAGANMEDINEGTHFKPVLPESSPESLVAPEEVKRVVFCCGKVYYDLARARALNEIDDIAIARVEELAPFPFDKVGLASPLSESILDA
jgi:2-oxoglutarate dehydrogenase complex dehydrogenase (E1) component-like enzyme